MAILLGEAAKAILASKYTIAFTGAGISVESGIAPFRGEGGLWDKYDPGYFDISYFIEHPEKSWPVIKEIFFDAFGKAKPNRAHEVLARWEEKGILDAIITQNIDNLHQEAGSRTVYEFHGNSQRLVTLDKNFSYAIDEVDLSVLPPSCPASGKLLKPDFIFFGEMIPPEAYRLSTAAASKADVCIIIGSMGEVMPASQMPYIAKQHGATIIEVNTARSNFSEHITDIFLKGKASELMEKLNNMIAEKN